MSSMGKIKLLLLLLITITLSNCKNNDKSTGITKDKTLSTENYKEVVFTKDYKRNSDISELNINYKNYLLKFKFIEDITLFQFIVDKKIVSDWKQVSFNFEYLPENYDGIRLLFNDENSEGILLLPGYTEEFPNLIVYDFDKKHFSYYANLEIQSAELNKIPLEELINEWKKGSFEANKVSDKYTVIFSDNSKKNILNFESSTSNDLLPASELKNYIDKIVSFEKRNLDNNSNSDNILKKIKNEGFKDIFEEECDLNQDGIQDKIIIYSTEFPKNIGTNDYKEFIVCVSVLGKIFQNKNIIEEYYPDNVAAGFDDIKIKDNYFTVEQVNGRGNGVVREYSTFKYSKETNEIMLHKYSRIETERSSGDENEKSYNYSVKNFGNISFDEYNSDTILEKCKK